MKTLEEKRAYDKEYRLKNKERCTLWKRRYRETHKEKCREIACAYRKRIKLQVLKMYSEDLPRCACCGETNWEFLTIDHINGGGSKQRKELGYSSLYDYLIKQNYPSGYRVLCMNCNFALGKYHYCPHTRTNNNDVS